MKQNITLQADNGIVANNSIVANTIEGIANVYSQLLGETVTTQQTIQLLHAQAAFVCMILPIGMPILFHAATVAWFGYALKCCKKAGL